MRIAEDEQHGAATVFVERNGVAADITKTESGGGRAGFEAVAQDLAGADRLLAREIPGTSRVQRAGSGLLFCCLPGQWWNLVRTLGQRFCDASLGVKKIGDRCALVLERLRSFLALQRQNGTLEAVLFRQLAISV